MKVERLARMPAITAIASLPVKEVVDLMVENDISAIAVVNDREKAVGIFTEHDNLCRVTAKCLNPETTWLSQVMTAPAVTVTPSTTVDEALRQMMKYHCRHLPVVDEKKKVIGIVSLRYLLRGRLQEKEASLETLAAYVEAGGPG